MNPFEKIEQVRFELSNMCPYISLHPRCPLGHLREEIEVLPLRTVLWAMDDLCRNDWQGKIAFHNYNEPLCDPRLYWLVSEAEVSGWPVIIWTNGWFLSQTVVDELVALGVKQFSISLYSKHEQERIKGLGFPDDVTVHLHPSSSLDDRLEWYDREPDRQGVCRWPEKNILVHSDGRVGLCCMDWKRNHTLGRIKEFGDFERIIVESRAMATRLAGGKREFDLCLRCPMRWEG